MQGVWVLEAVHGPDQDLQGSLLDLRLRSRCFYSALCGPAVAIRESELGCRGVARRIVLPPFHVPVLSFSSIVSDASITRPYMLRVLTKVCMLGALNPRESESSACWLSMPAAFSRTGTAHPSCVRPQDAIQMHRHLFQLQGQTMRHATQGR